MAGFGRMARAFWQVVDVKRKPQEEQQHAEPTSLSL